MSDCLDSNKNSIDVAYGNKDDISDVWKICALCSHCHSEETGREIPELIDSEFIVFHCDYYDARTREDYLMIPVDTEINTSSNIPCPHWEPVIEDEEY